MNTIDGISVTNMQILHSFFQTKIENTKICEQNDYVKNEHS